MAFTESSLGTDIVQSQLNILLRTGFDGHPKAVNYQLPLPEL
jgi:hypothetical protein